MPRDALNSFLVFKIVWYELLHQIRSYLPRNKLFVGSNLYLSVHFRAAIYHMEAAVEESCGDVSATWACCDGEPFTDQVVVLVHVGQFGQYGLENVKTVC